MQNLLCPRTIKNINKKLTNKKSVSTSLISEFFNVQFISKVLIIVETSLKCMHLPFDLNQLFIIIYI